MAISDRKLTMGGQWLFSEQEVIVENRNFENFQD